MREKRARRIVTMGAWNVRGWDGLGTRCDPVLKTQMMFSLFGNRGWSACLLSDLAFPENGIREYATDRQTWTVSIRGKVGIAMNEVWTSDWRKSGQKVWAMGHPDDAQNSPRKRGWFLVAGYAPTAKDEARGERDRFWETMHRVLAKAGGDPRIVIGGDMNAIPEPGQGRVQGHKGHLLKFRGRLSRISVVVSDRRDMPKACALELSPSLWQRDASGIVFHATRPPQSVATGPHANYCCCDVCVGSAIDLDDDSGGAITLPNASKEWEAMFVPSSFFT